MGKAYSLFHSFEEDDYKPKGPLGLFYTEPVHSPVSFHFKVLAAAYREQLSFGLTIWSRAGRFDILLKGSDAIDTIFSYRRLHNDSILSCENVKVRKSLVIDSLVWYEISFLLEDTFVNVFVNDSYIGQVTRPDGFKGLVKYGVNTFHGIVCYQDICVKNKKGTKHAAIQDALIVHPHLTETGENSGEGVFLPE